MTTANDLIYDPYDVEIARNPYPLFRRLREEAPLYHNPYFGFYALSRYDDVERGLVDRDTFVSSRGVTLEMLKANSVIPPGTVVLEDPPSHTVHRALLSRMFTARRVKELEPYLRRLCQELLDQQVGRGGFDLVGDLGSVVPMRLIGMLIGIPENDQEMIRDRFDRNRKRSYDERDDMLSGSIFAEYVNWRADHPSDDIMTQLMYSEFEDVDGTRRRMTREELLAYVNIVAAAGNETTKLLVGWTGTLLAENPDQRRVLVEDPALVPNAIEEILRCEPPTQQLCRYVAQDVELYGETVPEGSIVALLLGAANRDDRHYADPDRFDVRREHAQHFTLGFGSHYCLGQALARLEGRVILEELLDRFPEWEIDWERTKFAHDDTDLRGWESLPILTT